MTKPENTGLRRGLTHYGDPDFALYLRRSCARAMGYGEAMLERPVVRITDTASGFNNCHRGVPELIDATRRGAWQEILLPPQRETSRQVPVGTFRRAHIGGWPLRGALSRHGATLQ